MQWLCVCVCLPPFSMAIILSGWIPRSLSLSHYNFLVCAFLWCAQNNCILLWVCVPCICCRTTAKIKLKSGAKWNPIQSQIQFISIYSSYSSSVSFHRDMRWMRLGLNFSSTDDQTHSTQRTHVYNCTMHTYSNHWVYWTTDTAVYTSGDGYEWMKRVLI